MLVVDWKAVCLRQKCNYYREMAPIETRLPRFTVLKMVKNYALIKVNSSRESEIAASSKP